MSVCAQAKRESATTDDYVQLVDIFPAVLRRLDGKIDQTRGLIRIQQYDLNDPSAWQRFAAEMAE